MNIDSKLESDIQVHTEELESFAGRLRVSTKGRSARSIAREAEVSETVYRKYASGESEPTRPALIGLARAAGVHIEWLATGVGPMLASESTPASRAAEPDGELLLAAVQVIEQALELTRRTATPEVKARLITKTYNVLRHEGNVSQALNDVLAAVRSSLGEVADGR